MSPDHWSLYWQRCTHTLKEQILDERTQADCKMWPRFKRSVFDGWQRNTLEVVCNTKDHNFYTVSSWTFLKIWELITWANPFCNLLKIADGMSVNIWSVEDWGEYNSKGFEVLHSLGKCGQNTADDIKMDWETFISRFWSSSIQASSAGSLGGARATPNCNALASNSCSSSMFSRWINGSSITLMNLIWVLMPTPHP